MKAKRSSAFLILIFFSLLSLSPILPSRVQAACRNPNIAGDDDPFLRWIANSGVVEIKWFGHSFFQITSSQGTKIVTDPFGNMGYPMPEVWPHVVTVGKRSGNHSNVGLAKGDPMILRGLKDEANDWTQVNTTFRDVLIYNVPIRQRGLYGYEGSIKGSAFVFEMDGLCICHTGDIGEPFNEDQLDMIGHVDIVLLPIGGISTMGPENAKKVVEQLKPKIAIPMHYYNDQFSVQRFIDGPYKVWSLNTNKFAISKDSLPPNTEIFLLKVIREGDL